MQKNKVVILTREPEDNMFLVRSLAELNVETIEYPCIKTTLMPFKKKHAINGLELKDFSVIVFTSKRGVYGMKEVFNELFHSRQRLAAVGERTAAAIITHIGRKPWLTAYPPTSEALARILIQKLSKDDRVLHVRGNRTSGILKRVLSKANINLSELIVYRNETPEIKPLNLKKKGIVVLASPSAARCFLNANWFLKDQITFLAIGPTTAGFLKNMNISNVLIAKKPESKALIENIKNIINEP